MKKQVIELDEDLVNTADIADMLRLQRKYVTNEVTKRADFPKPLINLSRRTKLWRRVDVVKYATQPRR